MPVVVRILVVAEKTNKTDLPVKDLEEAYDKVEQVVAKLKERGYVGVLASKVNGRVRTATFQSKYVQGERMRHVYVSIKEI